MIFNRFDDVFVNNLSLFTLDVNSLCPFVYFCLLPVDIFLYPKSLLRGEFSMLALRTVNSLLFIKIELLFFFVLHKLALSKF